MMVENIRRIDALVRREHSRRESGLKRSCTLHKEQRQARMMMDWQLLRRQIGRQRVQVRIGSRRL